MERVLPQAPKEVWKPANGYSNYLVSNRGQVKRGAIPRRRYYEDNSDGSLGRLPERILCASYNPGGYLCVALITDDGHHITRQVSVLVLEAFVGKRPPGCVIHHKNHVRTDNKLENLEWVSYEEHGRRHSKNLQF